MNGWVVVDKTGRPSHSWHNRVTFFVDYPDAETRAGLLRLHGAGSTGQAMSPHKFARATLRVGVSHDKG